jgi:hypothetical protein
MPGLAGDTGQLMVIVLVVLVTVLVLACAGYALYRVVRLLREIRAEVRVIAERGLSDLFHQLQALGSLDSHLALPEGLPPVRGWAASPDFLLAIARHARASGPETVIECGSGVSTVVLARCMQLNGKGHVYSLEHNSRFAEITHTYLAHYSLLEWVTVVEAPLERQVLSGIGWIWYSPKLPLPERIDMLVIDGPPGEIAPLARYPAGPHLFGRMTAGASAFVDDTLRDDEREILRRWLEEFPKLRSLEHTCEKGCVELRGF